MMAGPLSRYLTEFKLSKEDNEIILSQIRAQEVKPQAPAEDKVDVTRVLEEKLRKEFKAAFDRDLAAAQVAERSRYERQLVEERARWVEEQATALGGKVAEAFTAIETTISDAVGRVLVPFASEAVRSQVMAELHRALEVLLASKEHQAIAIAGPGDLLEVLRAKLGARAESIRFETREQPDIRVTSNDVVIETQLQAWIGRMTDAVRAD